MLYARDCSCVSGVYELSFIRIYIYDIYVCVVEVKMCSNIFHGHVRMYISVCTYLYIYTLCIIWVCVCA